ncbi:helix-turn-helix domain-containing protein [Leifsonia kafniensis]|uniref:Helix-turn-helix domain-containing protein n=1 Tax=Leifsonia kafniensis TaxID=475957 RepID=A0ABP7KCN8_9MICO
MPVRVADLLERPDLGLSVVWATPELLELSVEGAYILDLPSPGHFLAANNLVLTSALWAQGPESAEVFISELAGKKAPAVVVGRIVIGEIPDYVEDACRRWGVALLTVSKTVSFKSIAQFIESSVATGEWPEISRSIGFDRKLLDTLASGPGAQGALRLFHQEFAVGCWVLESGGALTAVVGAEPSIDWRAAVWNRMLGAGRSAAVVPDEEGRPSSVWPIIGDGDHPVGFLVCSGDHREWPADLERVIRTLIAVVRVELELANYRRSTELEQVGELVTMLIDDTVSPGEASARLRLLGVDPSRPLIVVAATIDDRDYPPLAVLGAVTALVGGDPHTLLGTQRDAEATVVISGDDATPERLIELADRHTEAQSMMLGSRRLRLGVSEQITSIDQLAHAVTTARARMLSVTGTGPITWGTGSTPPSHEALLSMLPERVRGSFAQSLLAPLTEYDERHGSDFVLTLRVFLDSGGAWQQAAGLLHVHVNTLRYRIGRIEALTDRDLSSMKDRVDLYLALSLTP